jgi:hypothetical protein
MLPILKTLIEQYVKDIVPPRTETVRQTEFRASRIRDAYPKIFTEILNNFGEVDKDIAELQASSSSECCGEINGGSASTIYLQSEIINGGNASSTYI